MRIVFKFCMMMLWGMGSCGAALSGDSAFAEAADRGVPVWNQAYQENYKADSITDITANAHGAYVLLDPFTEAFQSDGAATLAALKQAENQIGAYISIGTGEDWRDDFAQLKPNLVRKQWGAWAGEYFVSTPNDAVVSVMRARIDHIAQLGFDWVEFDNMDWAQDERQRAQYQIAASAADGIAYYQGLCTYVRSKGMKCMAKSTVEQAELFDGVTYESYTDHRNWWDQAGAARFVSQGKLVVIVHYNEPHCEDVYRDYLAFYGAGVSFICEAQANKSYVHFNP